MLNDDNAKEQNKAGEIRVCIEGAKGNFKWGGYPGKTKIRSA